ncbi:hypothetical protein [Acidaminococcus timonensis]|uniref:hypothetical protein n=1 Tax=Acidaminococcus timonensis TaxID=1871002 RepID=UPI0026E9C4A4|nr:hypothetical protein [Acidaminococcus timonensis]
MKKNIIVLAAVFALIGVIISQSARFQRSWKSMKSNWGNGLYRTVTVYDYNGKAIKSWTGKFDVSSSEEETWFDDENGKRVIIHGGIVVNQENL